MSLSFAHLWQQQASSDVDVILLAPPAAEADQQDEQQGGAPPAKVELARFPAHSTLLSNSAVLWCRVLRWPDERPATRATKRARTSSSNSGEHTARGRLELELQDASEQEAALAVLQSLYAVKPLPELLSELSQEQQLQAAVLADMWQVPHVSSAAAQLLAAAANTPGALAETLQKRVLSAEALPDCLQPLLKSVLLSLLGDLEAVWANTKLQKQLLDLPLPAMQLLLSCDELKVASEDTVLYTAREYILCLEEEEFKHGQQLLAPLIRCPHLSRYWLSGAVHAADDDSALLSELRSQMKQLLMLRDVQGDYVVKAADLQEGQLLAGAPLSWALGRRVSKPVSRVGCVWRLDVSELRDAARSCAADRSIVVLRSPKVTPPLHGTEFRVAIWCVSEEGGVDISLYGQPDNLYPGMYYMCTFSWQLNDGGAFTYIMEEPYAGDDMSGWGDAFGVGLMTEGWDEVAWARKGLPTSGQLTIKFTVSGLPHAAVPPAAIAPVGRGRGRRQQ